MTKREYLNLFTETLVELDEFFKNNFKEFDLHLDYDYIPKNMCFMLYCSSSVENICKNYLKELKRRNYIKFLITLVILQNTVAEYQESENKKGVIVYHTLSYKEYSLYDILNNPDTENCILLSKILYKFLKKSMKKNKGYSCNVFLKIRYRIDLTIYREGFPVYKWGGRKLK